MGRTLRERRSNIAEDIVNVVLDLLETGGYDAVQLRVVAQRARVSLATIYRQFTTRNELIVAAIEQWMAANCYAEVSAPPPDETLYEGLMRVLRYVYEPWEQSPRILEAYHRARTGPGGRHLDRQGKAVIDPAARAVLADVDPAFIADLDLVLKNMTYAVVGRFTDGSLDFTEILPTLERAVFHLTASYESTAAGARERRAIHE
jgi:TetR/AcrR family transcriptional regulator, cholesterol catabolism regulator